MLILDHPSTGQVPAQCIHYLNGTSTSGALLNSIIPPSLPTSLPPHSLPLSPLFTTFTVIIILILSCILIFLPFNFNIFWFRYPSHTLFSWEALSSFLSLSPSGRLFVLPFPDFPSGHTKSPILTSVAWECCFVALGPPTALGCSRSFALTVSSYYYRRDRYRAHKLGGSGRALFMRLLKVPYDYRSLATWNTSKRRVSADFDPVRGLMSSSLNQQ